MIKSTLSIFLLSCLVTFVYSNDTDNYVGVLNITHCSYLLSPELQHIPAGTIELPVELAVSIQLALERDMNNALNLIISPSELFHSSPTSTLLPSVESLIHALMVELQLALLSPNYGDNLSTYSICSKAGGMSLKFFFFSPFDCILTSSLSFFFSSFQFPSILWDWAFNNIHLYLFIYWYKKFQSLTFSLNTPTRNLFERRVE